MGIVNYTKSQLKAIDGVESGKNILLTGRPGTGKTELLRDIVAKNQDEGKKILVTASTGLAASNLDEGRTIHSVLRWKPNVDEFDYSECSEKLKEADILVIDEVSMLNDSIINHIYRCWEKVDFKPQIIMSGDFFQLPPVTKNGMDIKYPFENFYWDSFELEPIVLKEIVRQQDKEFKDNLYKLMLGDASCIEYFNESSALFEIQGALSLTTKNEIADNINKNYFESMSGVRKDYKALGDVDNVDFSKTRVKKTFVVKKGMRVIALRNDIAGHYNNGSLGIVEDMDEDKIYVRFFNNKNEVQPISRITYSLDNTKKPFESVEIQQFPLSIAGAITIHKSQGQTFDYINIIAPQCWAPGQLYVALSRVGMIDNIHLKKKIEESDLKTSQKVINYYKKINN